MFQNIIDFVKKKLPFISQQKSKSTKLDQKLLKDLKGKKIPSWQQLKHIKKVFSPQEKKIFNISILLLVVGLIWGGIVWTDQYRETVPEVGGTYVEGVVGSPQLINPLFSSLNSVDKDISRLVYSGLMRYNSEQELVTDLARDYEVSDDGKTYTLKLRKDVNWHDGEKFDSEDVVFTYNKIKNKNIDSPKFVTFKDIEIKKLGKYKVQFQLQKPYSSFLHNLTIGILPKHIWQRITPQRIRLTQRNLQPIGTGPFEFKQLSKDNSGYIYKYELKRNDNFYRKPPYIQNLVFRFFRNYSGNNGVIQALKEQSIQGLRFIPFDKKDQIKKQNIKIHTLDLPQYTALFLNQKENKFLQDKTVRSAISLAIDKERILQEALQGQGEVIHSPILPGFSGYSDKLQSEFNVKQANKKLNEKFDKINKKEYRNLRKLSLLEERGLENTASTNTLESFYRESDPAIQEEYTGDEGEYDQAVIIESGSNSTSQRQVTLNLQGSQDSKIIISNDTDFENNKTRDFKKGVEWTLTPGNGKKWVFVKFQSPQEEKVVYDTIQLEEQFLSEKKYIDQEIEPNKERIDKIKQQISSELDNPQTFFRKDDENNIVSFEIVTQNSKEYKQAAKLIKSFMAELGIRVDLKFVTPRNLSQRVIKNRTYDSLLYGIVIGGDGDQYPFWHSSQTEPPGLNLSQYENEDIDKILDKIRTSTSSKKRKQLYQDFQQQITADQPAIFLYRPFYNYAQSTRIKGFDISGIYSPADRFSNVTNWFLETKNKWDFSS